MSEYIEFTFERGYYIPTSSVIQLNNYQSVGLSSIVTLPPHVKNRVIEFYLKSTKTGQHLYYGYLITDNDHGRKWVRSVLDDYWGGKVLGLNNFVFELYPYEKNGDTWRLHFYNDDTAKMFGFDPEELRQQQKEGLSVIKAKRIPMPFIRDDTILVKTNLVESFIEDSSISNTLALINLKSNEWNNVTIKAPIYLPLKPQNVIRVWITDSAGNDLELDICFNSSIVLHLK